MKRALSILLAIVLVMGMVPAALAFTDTADHWAVDSIERWSDAGVINGYEGNVFRPDQSITRGETAKILVEIMGYDTEADNTFSDLDDDWYTEYILKAVDAGVITGYEDGTVGPKATISRQEATTMIGRALEIVELSSVPVADRFTDHGQINDYATGYVYAMVAQGVITGYDEGDFRPAQSISRAEIATILDKAIENEGGTTPDPDPDPEPSSDPDPDPEPSTSPAPSDGTRYEAGTYLVGTDIPAGVYYIEETEVYGGEYYITDTADFDIDEFYDNEDYYDNTFIFFSHTFVEVYAGEYLTVVDGSFTLASGVGALVTDGHYGNGTYRVGIDIPAGTYQVVADEDEEYGFYSIYYSGPRGYAYDVGGVTPDTITVTEGQYLDLFLAEITI